MIKPMELYLAMIDKNRPALVMQITDTRAIIFKITTKYGNKSDWIKGNYYKIINWKQAGLYAQSYVDTLQNYSIPLEYLKKNKPIGKLTNIDIRGLEVFLREKKKKQNET